MCQRGPGAVARFHEMAYQHEMRLLGPRGNTPNSHAEALRVGAKQSHAENGARSRAAKRTKAVVGVEAWAAYRAAESWGATTRRRASGRRNAVTRIRATST
jgi:hypothetical protein